MLTTRPVTSLDYEFLRATHHDAYRDVTLRQFGVWDNVQQDEFFRASWDLGGLEVGWPIRLGTLHHNYALRLYQRLGFQERSRTDTHVLFEWLPE